MYRWVDHTAEVELAIEAASEPEVFGDAMAALAELLGFVTRGGEAETAEGAPGIARRKIAVTAPDRPALLAAWLEELVFVAESEGFVATGIEQLAYGERQLDAVVTGLVDDPPPIVKAVTYHRLTFQPRGDGYVATVVLDV